MVKVSASPTPRFLRGRHPRDRHRRSGARSDWARPSTSATRSSTTAMSSIRSRPRARCSSRNWTRCPRARSRSSPRTASAARCSRTPRPRGLPVIDATCPLVSKVHAQGRRYVATGPHAGADRPCRPSRGRGHARPDRRRGPSRRLAARRSRRSPLPLDRADRLYHADDALGRRHARDHRRARGALHRRHRPRHVGHLLCHAEPAGRGARARASRPTCCSWSARPTAPTPTACARSARRWASRAILIADGSELDPAWLDGVDDGRPHRRRLGARGTGPERDRRDRADRARSSVSTLDGLERKCAIPPAAGARRACTPRATASPEGRTDHGTSLRRRRAHRRLRRSSSISRAANIRWC